MEATRKAPQLHEMIAVITGAGSGIGAVVAQQLAQRGVQVALVGRTGSKLHTIQAAIEHDSGTAMCFPCDVTVPEQVQALHDAVVTCWGEPHLLFNNAGLHCEIVPISETTPERWIDTLQVNLVGPYLLCRAFMGGMMRQGWGRILNVSSAAALDAPGNVAAVYQLSKVSLNHFTRQLAKEVAGSGVTANALHPGEVKSDMWAAIKHEAELQPQSGHGMSRWAAMVEETGGDPPEKTAALVLDMLSPESDAINGEFLWIKDGIKQPRKAW